MAKRLAWGLFVFAACGCKAALPVTATPPISEESCCNYWVPFPRGESARPQDTPLPGAARPIQLTGFNEPTGLDHPPAVDLSEPGPPPAVALAVAGGVFVGPDGKALPAVAGGMAVGTAENLARGRCEQAPAGAGRESPDPNSLRPWYDPGAEGYSAKQGRQ
jgi:hypothetical protein